MLTLQELKDLSDRLTYQGKRCFSINEIDWRNGSVPPEGYVYVSTWIWADDVEDSPSKRIGMKIKIEMGGLASIKELEQSNLDSQISHIKDTLVMLQMHEIHETLMLDGKNIFNPHKFGISVTREEMREAA